MGRSRIVSRPADEDANPGCFRKSKRKKTSPGPENAGTAISTVLNERKAGLYHCNYCNKDLSGLIRFKCAVCTDFDLCVECFSVGAELNPHKSNHPYRVMDNLSFPFVTPDWNADEELLLLEAISTYGFGNWQEIADNVGSKTKSECSDHYHSAYMNSPCFPFPDLSHAIGKSKEELIALGKELTIKKEVPVLMEPSPKEELPMPAEIKDEASGKEDVIDQSLPNLAGIKKKVNGLQAKESIKSEVADQQPDRSVGEKKPRLAGDQALSVTESYGYNFKRQEFDVEYDNDAEQLLADMDFKESDTDAEHDLKLQVLHVYSKRLDERKRRKNFILERNLLYPDTFEMSLSPEERQIYKRYKVFARFHSKEEHEELLKTIIEEHRILRRIQDLQEARTAGCRTASEANRYIEEKRKKEAEETGQRLMQGVPGSVAGKALKSPRGLPKSLQPFGAETLSKVTGPIISSSLDNWDVNGLLGADLLSETEKKMCNEIRILPAHYLKMLQTLSMEIKNGHIKQKSDAYTLFKVDPYKVDKVYDMLVQKGIAQS
ncbi:PREDICTED: transcriptional adapter ADA2a isoform X3 [Tarenaya hassleriana]|uniref:transcriptional adapter ADA2a isoform X3 n=1 Tax=Tarenaya hassleriana TaxID=28532 RepID=UPI00053C2AA5|nr:PREDICTED: transcriptional adapter ADA2a isoform X3 [Tarenaya hassleriana]